ncbi:hypothetical protein FQZ97_1082860 [compost metagenome]
MGPTMNSASTRGNTRKSKGFTPRVVSASISSFARMLPICAAKAAPTRPASTMPTSKAATSRTTPTVTRSAM